ncbi:hypothetical protein D9M73_70650 [compost metagenome]|nr:MAG TPA: hypothetical protein [Caudoviricetes sp.]
MTATSFPVLAQQGHRYALDGREVLCVHIMGLGYVGVAPIDRTQPYPLGKSFLTHDTRLTPLPMRYFHDQVPK